MYDTIIIGAGSSGCVVASRLGADPNRKILVLEAGRAAPINSDVPSDWVTMFNTSADWGYYTEPQAGCRGRRIFWPRGKMVGGSGALNAMIYIRGLPSDYDAWEALGCAGWGWKDVFPVFLKSENNANFRDSPYHGNFGPLHIEDVPYVDKYEHMWIEAATAAGYKYNPDYNGEAQEGVGLFQFTIKNGERWGTGKSYLRPALERGNITLKTGVLVTGLIIEGGRVKGVNYLVNGVAETVHADSEVVMTGGAIGTAQIMMLSGIGPADELAAVGIKPVHDLPGVGKDLQDHLNIPITFYTKEPMGIGAWTDDTIAASFEEWRDHRTGVRTSPWVASGGHVCSREGIEPDLQLYGAITPHRDYTRFLGGRSGITAHSTLQRPKSRGEIKLRSADPIEYPSIDPKYFISDPAGIDLATMVRGARINRNILAQSPIRELIDHELAPSAECQTDAEIAEYVRGHMTTLYHPSSTCRMGIDRMAVTDPATMKVHGLEGIRIADASAIPLMVSGNLNAPTIMVAERAAEKILGG
ncbi:GMC family oxidoreductase N-terminal domain-containing protein [Rhizobium sp. KVB221]|uniref:GMC family oxidoreductase N-terminal domain-containing protein n=1 Tax=Rhizobium setariae TaxID=2801340 RepID=A0A937CRC2_9HYPH|nr:GMC family oxidoreductase N-terminal domain-containing protein [Rhizobium setariae]MBL0374302.1 GMC family oxidoreductase N-terminal domain-containing protein [Rhizobium setariae]